MAEPRCILHIGALEQVMQTARRHARCRSCRMTAGRGYLRPHTRPETGNGRMSSANVPPLENRGISEPF